MANVFVPKGLGSNPGADKSLVISRVKGIIREESAKRQQNVHPGINLDLQCKRDRK